MIQENGIFEVRDERNDGPIFVTPIGFEQYVAYGPTLRPDLQRQALPNVILPIQNKGIMVSNWSLIINIFSDGKIFINRPGRQPGNQEE